MEYYNGIIMKGTRGPGSPWRIQDSAEAKEAIQGMQMPSSAMSLPAEIMHVLYSIQALLGANGQEVRMVQA